MNELGMKQKGFGFLEIVQYVVNEVGEDVGVVVYGVGGVEQNYQFELLVVWIFFDQVDRGVVVSY